MRKHKRAGDVVVDPCAGSGTTLLAAKKNGRHSYGFEIYRPFYTAAIEKMLVLKNDNDEQMDIFEMLKQEEA